jgi:crotonobetainyl-CoA:carnitine CoA-transferase CaiB-like acyl-CoA transferase
VGHGRSLDCAFRAQRGDLVFVVSELGHHLVGVLAEEPSLRKTGTVVEVDHPTRGKYLTVGNPIKMSDSPTEVVRSPLLGEHTDEVMAELGFAKGDIDALRAAGVI